ncbi:sensor histidine kinase [Streptomyces solicathayae]|uniref:histidine kinase n=1 Tax=Streptomyces solicathayae TaxID=3081768 RepID=A0ABZ0M5R8_9ACTN|nr:sensor histidine kinase [Streptomyces sp. HUAS YS2]WOX26399.1 sensor histidine kinase [Streptomyces sp. HUAS YS2]
MDTTPTATATRPAPPRPPHGTHPEGAARALTRSATAAWAGGVLYVVLLLLLLGGAPRSSPTYHGVASLLAASLLVGVLRRTPLLALVLTLLGATAVVVLPPRPNVTSVALAYQGEFLSFLAVDLVLGCVVATRKRGTAIAAVTASLLVQLLLVGGFAHGESLTVNAVITVLAMAASCMVGLLVRERREHATALRAQEVSEAVTAERLRIARELHDMVAHSIGIVAIQAGVGGRVIETQPAEAREALRVIEATSRETLSNLRRTLVALRKAAPGGDADGEASLAPSPGLADLDALVAATVDAGLRVDVHRSGTRRPLPADVDLAAYRIVQEALTNVVRHAGAGHCRVTVDHGDEELTVEIVDDGRGAPESGSAHGFGIVGMRERVALLHGRLSVGTRPEGGFRVAARLPLPASTDVAGEGR